MKRNYTYVDAEGKTQRGIQRTYGKNDGKSRDQLIVDADRHLAHHAAHFGWTDVRVDGSREAMTHA